jgi:hypothetical protein
MDNSTFGHCVWIVTIWFGKAYYARVWLADVVYDKRIYFSTINDWVAKDSFSCA